MPNVQAVITDGNAVISGQKTPEVFQDRIGVRYTGNLDIDPVRTLLIYLRLRAVILYTLLQLVDRVLHIVECAIMIKAALADEEKENAL